MFVMNHFKLNEAERTQPKEPPGHHHARSGSRSGLEEALHRRQVSLTEAETFFLHGLLIDEDPARDPESGGGSGFGPFETPTKVLNDDVLFHVPVPPKNLLSSSKGREHQNAQRPPLLGLWKAYEAGVPTQKLVRQGSLPLHENSDNIPTYPTVPPKKRRHRRTGSYSRPPVESIILEAENEDDSERNPKDVADAVAAAAKNIPPRPGGGKPPKPPTPKNSNLENVGGEAGAAKKNQQHHRRGSSGLSVEKLMAGGEAENGIKRHHHHRRGGSGLGGSGFSVENLMTGEIDGSNNKRHHRRGSSGFSVEKMMTGAEADGNGTKKHHRRGSSGFSAFSMFSDVDSEAEVRHEGSHNASVGSSWDENDHMEHFDAWEVLKDEYAEDFGFDYSGRGVTIESILAEDDGEAQKNTFQILGTSAADASASPHVLSPPLMDALMNHLPQHLVCHNFWLKFSLVRDGACLGTLKQYVRASPNTIIAIETPNGEVFGSFTSEAWRTNLGYYGSGPAFVWKMKHGRRTKCHSLFDQAQLESEIDVFPLRDYNALVQVCRHDSLAVGGDDPSSSSGYYIPPPSSERQFHPLLDDLDAKMDEAENSGFAIALEDDLLVGTTSPSGTFGNPTLCGPSPDRSQTFEVSGLEVWTFSPCMDVKAAERLEMTKYFMSESVHSNPSRSSSRLSTSTASGSFSSRDFTSADLIQDRFYQRVGHDSESQERRNRWQYVNMMSATDGASKGIGASPKFYR